MIVLSDSIQPTSRTTTTSRRESTSTTSPPPPYESSRSDSLIHDEKRRHIDAHSNTSKEPLTDSKVYAEPPPAFSRIAAVSTQTLVPFAPMTVLVEGSGKALDKGFSLELPPSSEAPHPFERRDISAADWNRYVLVAQLVVLSVDVNLYFRFMQDLQDCTALSNCTKNKTLFIPIALGFGPGGSSAISHVATSYSLSPIAFFISEAIKAKMRKEKLARAINLINAWNQVSSP